MRQSTGRIPACLTKLYKTTIALYDADFMLSALHQSDLNAAASQIPFLESKIKELENQQKALMTEAEAFLEPIREGNAKAYFLIKLHFFVGMEWETIGNCFGKSGFAEKTMAYRALDKLKVTSK